MIWAVTPWSPSQRSRASWTSACSGAAPTATTTGKEDDRSPRCCSRRPMRGSPRGCCSGAAPRNRSSRSRSSRASCRSALSSNSVISAPLGRPACGRTVLEGPATMRSTCQDAGVTVDDPPQTVDDAALLAVIVGQSPVGVGVFGVFDTDARYVRVNPALQRIVGLDLTRMIGRTVREVVPGEVGEFADARLREVLATGRPVIGADLEGRLPSGPGNRSLVVSYFRLEGPEGSVLGAASIVSDVSDRHRARRALDRANSRLALLGRTAGVLNASLDLEETLSGLGRLVVPEIADHCVVDLVEARGGSDHEDGVVLRRYAIVHAPGIVPPAAPRNGEEPWTPVGRDVRYPPGHPVHEAFVRREAFLRHIDPEAFDFEAVAPNPASARSARDLRMRSALAVPLQARGRVVGVLSLIQ